MSSNRLAILLLVLVIGLGSVAFLPKVVNSTPQGIALTLPTYVGQWYGEDQKISELELQVLAKDTQFAKKLYTDGRGGQVFVSIVLSGHDLDNSIHRPERCLPAQGWSIADSKTVELPTQIARDGELAVTRLHNLRKVVTKEGQTVPIYSLNYYWFVGWNNTTPSHLERTYIDIRDRIFYGYNQRWAYITVMSHITEGLTQFGKSEEETDKMIREFIGELLPKISAPAQNRQVAAK